MNTLYFGDCLDILKQLYAEHPKGFIDLIYIDPPFNSKRDYNVLFESLDLTEATAQKQAFSDTWSNVSYIDTLNELQDLDIDLYKFLSTLNAIGLSKSAVSYLVTMSIRILYMHKVLKDTGSFYLHCDPTMSHYLKILCDLIFDENNFINEIVWKRAYGHGDSRRSLGRSHDVLLFYSKSSTYTLNRFFHQHDEKYLKSFFKHEDERGIYKLENLTSPNPRPNLMYEYKGYPSPAKGWRVNLERMQILDKENRLYFPKKEDGRIMKKVYLHDLEGQPMTDIWTDIRLLSANDQERLGYPTQKPQALMERIIEASSNRGDLVADFFCGCGTTIAAAQKLNRNWLGVDISHLAIKLIVDRLTKPYNKPRAKAILENIEIKGMPKDLASAHELAENTKSGRFGFQDWVIEVMLGGVVNKKKVADGGYDGYLTFYKDPKTKGTAIIEVKSGKVNVKNVREFIQVVKVMNADIGAFVCFEDTVTKEMQIAAKQEGYYNQEYYGQKFPKIQIITIQDLFEGRDLNTPGERSVFKKATKKLDSLPENTQQSLLLE